MSGVLEAISKSTNITTETSGTVLNASLLDAYMADCYDNSNGDVATDLFVGTQMRARIDTFAQKSNIVVNNPGGLQNIVKTVSSYESSMGSLQLHKHRYIFQSGDGTGRILAVNPEKLKIAWLDKPFIQDDLSKAGPYDPKAVYGSLTLEVRNQDSNFYVNGFLNQP